MTFRLQSPPLAFDSAGILEFYSPFAFKALHQDIPSTPRCPLAQAAMETKTPAVMGSVKFVPALSGKISAKLSKRGNHSLLSLSHDSVVL